MSKSQNPLEILHVIDRLEVGPIKVEKQRVTAPYTVFKDGKSDSIDFVYKFEEDVFEPGEWHSENLASMLAAQIALNYGLFCEEIVFRGTYDKTDQRFLEAMARNTAREIYVLKFLHDNPFLLGDARKLPIVRKDNYLHARLSYHREGNLNRDATNTYGWYTDSQRYAVLSSGGKDSLLSYGLLKEMEYETHPLFVNESGRHWFTALNAYRFLDENDPNTARVWTNSDRVFSWMLRHFPFVRQDFASVRADIYPIRLYTVAVFLFGVLPLLRKRNIGRIVIGDEYDTTERENFHGITHYSGLYDQSRYFDNALTRYYQRKEWHVTQFSILRNMSELLIEKILVERYPHLQRQQLSCHATHKEGERIHPCGRCEKCRRIVGMLTAIGADPRNCGYNDAQIEACLRELVKRGVHQEAAGSQHMLHLLQEQGKIPAPSPAPKPHPEVLSLRIDPERSPVEVIPLDLRRNLFELITGHAKTAMKKHGRRWLEIDLLNDPMLYRPDHLPNDSESEPFGFEHVRPVPTQKHYLLGELTWPQIAERLKEVDIALLPVGAIEQHGPHLPLDTDAFDADFLARQVAMACSNPKPLVLPLVPYGVSYHHDDFAGTLSVSNETLARFVYEIGMSAARNGINKLIIINGHGGNAATLQFAAQMINRDAHIFTCVDTGETSDTDVNRLSETQSDVHAGEIETSTSLAIRPHLVHMDKAKKLVPHFSSRYLNFSSQRRVDWYARTAKISPSGVMGDPTKASAEKGLQMWEVMIKNLTEFVEHLKHMTLNEIYERRY